MQETQCLALAPQYSALGVGNAVLGIVKTVDSHYMRSATPDSDHAPLVRAFAILDGQVRVGAAA